MKIIEKVYIILSFFSFLYCWFLNDAGEMIVVVAIPGMLFGILGIFLTYQARDRVQMFWTLIIASLMTSSLFIWLFFGPFFIYTTIDGEIKFKLFDLLKVP